VFSVMWNGILILFHIDGGALCSGLLFLPG
jgi:hypothetical protein